MIKYKYRENKAQWLANNFRDDGGNTQSKLFISRIHLFFPVRFSSRLQLSSERANAQSRCAIECVSKRFDFRHSTTTNRVHVDNLADENKKFNRKHVILVGFGSVIVAILLLGKAI